MIPPWRSVNLAATCKVPPSSPLPSARAGQGSWDGFIIHSGSSTPVCVPLQPYVLPIPVCWSVNKGRIIHHHQAKKGKAGDLHLKSFRFTATSGERLRHPSGACVRVIGVTWRLMIGREATSRLPTCLSAGSTKRLPHLVITGYPKGGHQAAF